jgi:hypothetical protein
MHLLNGFCRRWPGRGRNGLGWNALNITIMVALLLRARQRLALA